MKPSLKHLAVLVAMTVALLPLKGAEKSLAEKAVANPELGTLVVALKAANLVDVVANGDFTVLAPTNAAFAKLPKGTVANLLKPENKEQLQSILKYHLVPNGYSPANMLATRQIETIEGRKVTVGFNDGRVRINDSVLLKAGEVSKRGTIHLIDAVLIPPPIGPGNIVETASKAGSFQTLIAAAKAAGLVGALTGDGTLTVFAPTDAAFEKLPKGTVAHLIKPENKQQLADILKYHVVAGKITAGDALNAGSAATLQGNQIKISYADGGMRVQEARILSVNVEASNGVIHVIDSVLIPPKNSAQQAMTVIQKALAKGVPAYNHGDTAGCARIYMAASKKLMNESGVPEHGKRALHHAVRVASKTHCTDSQSWTLREGLDQAHAALFAQTLVQ